MTNKGGTYIEVDPGVELYVKDVGSGDPIVFIPGFTFSNETFSEQIAYFSKTNRVIAIDPRSHGRSTVTVHGNEYVTHGTDLIKVLKKLDVNHPTLVGWSFGCLTIWEYLKQAGPDDVNAFIFVDMPPKSLSVHHDEWVEGSLDDIGSIYNTFLRDSKGHRAFIVDYIENVMIQRKLEEDELDWLVDMSLQTPYYIAGNLFASGMFSDYRNEARRASESAPTLTIVAEHWAETASNYFKNISPQTKVEKLGGHMMFWEHSEQFNQMVEAFLDDIK